MTSLRDQEKLAGDIRPLVLNVMNFTKRRRRADAAVVRGRAHAVPRVRPRPAWPAVRRHLSDDVRHQRARPISSSCRRSSTSIGSSSRRSCASSPGTTRPASRCRRRCWTRLMAARNFNQGFATVEYIASRAGRSRPASRCRRPTASTSTPSRSRALARIGMPDEIAMRHRPPHFQHVFSGGGYAAAYYSYMWSEVLDADAFAAFEETGDIFDPATAKRLRDNIYSAGGSARPGRGLQGLPRPAADRRRVCSRSVGWISAAA